jgi:hypothetical protein
MKLSIDTYYDITCDICCKHRSTDYGMGMSTSKTALYKWATAEGWKVKNNKTLCPDCARRLIK